MPCLAAACVRGRALLVMVRPRLGGTTEAKRNSGSPGQAGPAPARSFLAGRGKRVDKVKRAPRVCSEDKRLYKVARD